MEPVYFSSPSAFRAWLEEHHALAGQLWVGYHKRATGTPSMTWPESVDEALCFGGRMRPAGLAAYEARDPDRLGPAHDERPRALPEPYASAFREASAAGRRWIQGPPRGVTR